MDLGTHRDPFEDDSKRRFLRKIVLKFWLPSLSQKRPFLRSLLEISLCQGSFTQRMRISIIEKKIAKKLEKISKILKILMVDIDLIFLFSLTKNLLIIYFIGEEWIFEPERSS